MLQAWNTSYVDFLKLVVAILQAWNLPLGKSSGMLRFLAPVSQIGKRYVKCPNSENVTSRVQTPKTSLPVIHFRGLGLFRFAFNEGPLGL
jgi:hypothetical protein